MRLKSFIFLFLIFICLFLPFKSVYAADFRADYQVEYFLSENEGGLDTRVLFNVKITNFRSDAYVSRFSIAFPASFPIRNLKTNDDKGEITPKVTTDNEKVNIDIEFSDPNIGKGSINNFYLNFNQDNLFKVNGNVWEVILPTIENKDDFSSYSIVVHLPENSQRKISIAKPKPSLITGNTIYWNNPSTKTVYAVFGEEQYYQIELNYNLENERITPVYVEIAFPPDTLYQKIYLNNISPKPEKVYLDEDGNYMGRFFLKPKEKKQILFEGIIKIQTKPRTELRLFTKEQFNKQKNYLLTADNYWTIDNPEEFTGLSSAEGIYNYVSGNLKYSYERVDKKIARLGAKTALANPDKAVCTEFADVFVALCREKGIYSREVEGYGFSNDSRLRPLSLSSDVLHAWPEYYDEKNSLWIPVDPTWQNTSGIDYFSSFDLNHIVFAIHGKKADYPLPAGMYKLEDSKDILIKPVSINVSDKLDLKANIDGLPAKISDKEKYSAKLIVENKGNVFLYDLNLTSETLGVTVNPSIFKINVLAPYEIKEIGFNLESDQKLTSKQAFIKIFYSGKEITSMKLTVVPYWIKIAGYGLVLITIVGIFIIVKLRVKRSSKAN